MSRLLFWGAFLGCLYSLPAQSQSARPADTLVDYAGIVSEGNQALDSGKYQRALSLFQQVPEGDSMYPIALYRSMTAANNDSTRYAAGLKLARQSVALPFSPLHQSSLIQLANSYILNGHPDSANRIYQQIEAKSPHSYIPWLEKGLIMLRQKRYPEAVAALETAAVRDPVQGRVHLSLALAYLYQRRPSEAYLALITSLFYTSDPTSAGRTILLLSAVAQSNLDELSPAEKPAAVAHPLWDETDELLLARLPLSKDYQFRGTMSDDALVKVLHALLEKLPAEGAAADTNFATQVYAPLFRNLYTQGRFDELVQYAFSGYGIEQIDKVAERNKRGVNEVREQVNDYFRQLFGTGVRPLATRSKAPIIRYRVPDEEDAIMTGTILSTDPLKWAAGPMQAYSYGVLIAEGHMDSEGERTGTWTGYHSNGQIERITQYVKGKEEGIAREYSTTGIRSKINHMRRDTSFYEEYYDASGRLERIASRELRSGKEYTRQIRVYPNGQFRDTMEYIDDKRREGIYREYDASGKVIEENSIQNENLNGPFKQWYPFTHALRTEGALKDDELDGQYTKYHPNGRLSLRGTYRKGMREGWFDEWNETGMLQERSRYEQSKILETTFFDDSARIYERIVFEKEEPRLVERRDATGQLRSQSTFKGRGLEVVRLTYPNGKPKTEFPHVDGQPDGVLHYYAPSGLITHDATYRAGTQLGWETYYYPNGRIRSERYRGGTAAGRYRRFSEAGVLLQESFLDADGNRQGPSTEYATSGKPVQMSFWTNGLANGPYISQDPEGRRSWVGHYTNDLLLAQELYDTTGQAWQYMDFPQGNGLFTGANLNRQIVGRDSMTGGRREGFSKIYYVPGLKSQEAYYQNGMLEGELTSWHPNGQKSMHDTERQSSTEGIRRTWDEAGHLTSEASYVENEQTGPEWRYHGGILRSVRSYKSDVLDGPYLLMYGPADTLARLDFAEGHLLRTQTRDSTGRWMASQEAVEGNADILTYYPKGGKAVDYHYRHNVQDGTQVGWHPDGTLADRIQYTKGCLNGTLERFYANGTPYTRSTIANDQYQGEELTWYPNGKVCSRIQFLNGMRHGDATYYDQNEKQPPVTLVYRHNRLVSRR
jgi:antitoxin component YwqK of YwqJK toxin-antitoxin module